MTSVKQMTEFFKKVQDLDEEDPVNFPSHYNKGGIGCIDAIKGLVKEMDLNTTYKDQP